jgi:adenine/guanine phosphoribosyltransferase-like PRPP-binding protein
VPQIATEAAVTEPTALVAIVDDFLSNGRTLTIYDLRFVIYD